MNRMNILLPILLLIACHAGALAQGAILPLDNPAYHALNRLEIKSGRGTPYHTSLQPYQRGAVTRFALMMDTAATGLSDKDQADLRYIFRDNNEWLGQGDIPTTLAGRRSRPWPDSTSSQMGASMADPRYERSRKPILRWFYPTPANLIEINTPVFHLRVNPLLNLKYGNQQDSEEPYFLNQRGVELRGGFDDRVYISMNILESQAQFPGYVRQWFDQRQALPGVGLVKSYSDDLFGVNNGYDFLLSQGHVGFNFTPHIGAQIGYGRNFIGNGYRSVLLSDFSNNYFFLKLNWEIWKFHFQNIFGELSVSSANDTPDGTLVPKKYFAAHHLSINLTPSLNVGLFEAVVFNRQNQFELQYLNPVVLYRTVEHGLGSPDNVLIGLDGKWNFLRRFQLYSQLMIDEFVFKELFIERRGWWANKFALQAGLKYIDVAGIDHLDLQLEFNTARPYTFTHTDSISSYAHYRTPLGHPLGANFREWVGIIRYQPVPRLQVQARMIRALTGEDGNNTNWGSNILLSSRRIQQTYGNEIGQGVKASIDILGVDLSYQLFHNVFLDVQYFQRRKDSADNTRDRTDRYAGGGLRVNLANWRQDF